MKQYRFFLLSLFLVIQLLATPASEESVRELMNITGAGNLGIQLIDQMLPSFKAMIPAAPEQFWSDMRSEINAEDLINLVIPVYQKHFTEDDIQELIHFYNSDVGKKYTEMQPAIAQESMVLGQQWGEEIARNILHKYSELQNQK